MMAINLDNNDIEDIYGALCNDCGTAQVEMSLDDIIMVFSMVGSSISELEEWLKEHNDADDPAVKESKRLMAQAEDLRERLAEAWSDLLNNAVRKKGKVSSMLGKTVAEKLETQGRTVEINFGDDDETKD